jgi:sulfur-oxidizing protein SoxY
MSPIDRRQCLRAGLALVAVSTIPGPATAAPAAMALAILAFTGGQTPRDGRVQLDIAPLVENGNTVPVSVRVAAAMSADDQVTAIALFNERNPQPEVAVFHLTPRSGRATVATRIRLADSQRIVAVARFGDGTYLSASVDVVVTIAGCIES